MEPPGFGFKHDPICGVLPALNYWAKDRVARTEIVHNKNCKNHLAVLPCVEMEGAMKTGDEGVVLISASEAARRLGFHPSKISRLVKAGKIKGHRFGDGPKAPIRIDVEELKAYAERCKVRKVRKVKA